VCPSHPQILQHKEEPELLKRLKDALLEAEAQLAASQQAERAAQRQLEHEKRLTAEAVKAVQAPDSDETPALVAEVRQRGSRRRAAPFVRPWLGWWW
jgi:transcription elongation GreA/GreB family factor